MQVASRGTGAKAQLTRCLSQHATANRAADVELGDFLVCQRFEDSRKVSECEVLEVPLPSGTNGRLADGCRRVEGGAMEAHNGGSWVYLQPADFEWNVQSGRGG